MLTADAVRRIVLDCLFRADELENGQPKPDVPWVKVEGVVRTFGFVLQRVEGHAVEIAALLCELPDHFFLKDATRNGGGGGSFLQACVTREGMQWAEHLDIEALVALGIATKQAAWLLPRDHWPLMPGGLPYFYVNPRSSE